MVHNQLNRAFIAGSATLHHDADKYRGPAIQIGRAADGTISSLEPTADLLDSMVPRGSDMHGEIPYVIGNVSAIQKRSW